MPSTTRGYPYPGDGDAPDVPADIEALAEAVDDDVQSVAGDSGVVRCRLRFDTDTSIATPSVKLPWQNEDYDPLNFHDGVNPSRATVPVGYGGLYLATTSVGFAQKTGGTRNIEFKVNNASVKTAAAVAPSTVGATRLPLVTALLLAAGDYVEVEAFHNSGGPITIESAYSHFALTRLAV